MCDVSDLGSDERGITSLVTSLCRHQQQQARNKRQLFQSAVCSEETSCDTVKNLFAIMGNYAPAGPGLGHLTTPCPATAPWPGP